MLDSSAASRRDSRSKSNLEGMDDLNTVFLEMGNFPNFGDFEGPIGIFFAGIPHLNNR